MPYWQVWSEGYLHKPIWSTDSSQCGTVFYAYVGIAIHKGICGSFYLVNFEPMVSRGALYEADSAAIGQKEKI